MDKEVFEKLKDALLSSLNNSADLEMVQECMSEVLAEIPPEVKNNLTPEFIKEKIKETHLSLKLINKIMDILNGYGCSMGMHALLACVLRVARCVDTHIRKKIVIDFIGHLQEYMRLHPELFPHVTCDKEAADEMIARFRKMAEDEEFDTTNGGDS